MISPELLLIAQSDWLIYRLRLGSPQLFDHSDITTHIIVEKTTDNAKPNTFVNGTNFFFTTTKIQNKISSGKENKKMYEFYSNWHRLSSTINPVGSLAIGNTPQNFIAFKLDRPKGLLSNSDASTKTKAKVPKEESSEKNKDTLAP